MTWTDENGNYVFGIRTDKTYEFGTMPGSDDANYKATVTQPASASEFNGWISGEGAVMRISVNQDQSKVKYEGLAEEAGWVVTVILNKQ